MAGVGMHGVFSSWFLVLSCDRGEDKKSELKWLK